MDRISRSRPSPAMVVALIALFVSLSGVAWAANTVGSDDVVDNSLQSVDLKNNAAVTSADVVNDNVSGGGLANSDIQSGEVKSSEIAGEAVKAPELATGAVVGGVGGDVLDQTLTGDDIANPQRAINLPLGSFINCTADQPIDFTSGADTAPDFVTPDVDRLYLAWDTGDTDSVCTSVVMPPDVGGAAPTVRLLSTVGTINNNAWQVKTFQQRVGEAENSTPSTAAPNCEQFLTDGEIYVCSVTPTLTEPGPVQPNDVFTVTIARSSGSNEMRLHGVQFEYTARQ